MRVSVGHPDVDRAAEAAAGLVDWPRDSTPPSTSTAVTVPTSPKHGARTQTTAAVYTVSPALSSVVPKTSTRSPSGDVLRG